MGLKVLVVDVGGNNIKLLASGHRAPLKVPSGPTFTPGRMVAAVRKATAGWTYRAVSIGFPAPVRRGRIAEEPVNLGRGWVRYDFRRAFKRPVRIINDAVMQALGSYRGRPAALPRPRHRARRGARARGPAAPARIAHLPYRNGLTYEDLLGKRGLDAVGKKRWRRLVFEIVPRLREAFQVDEVVLGGGNAKLLASLPRGCRLGDNSHAFTGGFRLWEQRPARRRREGPPHSAPPKVAACSSRSATRRTRRVSRSRPGGSSRSTSPRSCC